MVCQEELSAVPPEHKYRGRSTKFGRGATQDEDYISLPTKKFLMHIVKIDRDGLGQEKMGERYRL